MERDDERERARQRALASLREAQAGFVGVSEEEAERGIAGALEEIRQAFVASRAEMGNIPSYEIEREIAQAMTDVEELRRQRRNALASLRDVQAAFADVPDDDLERGLDKALADAKTIQITRRAPKRDTGVDAAQEQPGTEKR